MKALIVLLLITNSVLVQAESESVILVNAPGCESTREYITTLEYLRSRRKEIGIEELEARKIAESISSYCTGSAQKFIRTFETLLRVEVGSRASLEMALKLTPKDDNYTAAFVGIFQQAYLKEFLDLDLNNSLLIAESLSAGFKAPPGQALQDFSTIVEFCKSRKELQLSLGNCARIAARVTKRGEKFQVGLAKTFIDTFEYLPWSHSN